MTAVETEITALEERLRLAELGPDPTFFQETLADDAVLVGEDGTPALAKTKVVAAHEPGTGPTFTRVEMEDLEIIDHGSVAIVTCQGTFEGPDGEMTRKFMRVWMRKGGHWRIVAGSVSK